MRDTDVDVLVLQIKAKERKLDQLELGSLLLTLVKSMMPTRKNWRIMKTTFRGRISSFAL